MDEHRPRKTGELLSAAPPAAEKLLCACRHGDDSQRLEMVRELARDLRCQLETLSVLARSEASPDVLVEAALRCGDLATLAACNAASLSPCGRRLALEAARDAREVTAGVLDALGEKPPENALRDARSADWRASLALRQLGVET
ncbi:hypothetical protein Rxycam_01631 [Rubrobacter xylanophilus DSM 9941]|uniref:hypothetical protein n=1 Tax=Rubrobacter xylanophilus TaxID=49319 RepID=UPI001C63BC3F|nr:hypothetical protein [Rubrobacter xylanophilus]QYJ15803.1 hypothetical protein Rxycam_01631 [Rubrobacter xylanophilus DSM 9941]